MVADLKKKSIGGLTLWPLERGTFKVDLVVQSLPPAHDAIGEYTACLAAELALHHTTKILTANQDAMDPIDRVSIDECIRREGSRRFSGLSDRLQHTTSDAVVLQYNPFGWGRRGWVPDLVRTIERFKNARPDVRLGVMFHETFMMNPGFRSWVMRQYQRRQFDKLVSISDVCFFSTELWAIQHRARNTNTAVHLPVGANLPIADDVGSDMFRHQYDIGEDDFVCGVFGGAHPSRMLPWIESAVGEIRSQHAKNRRLYFIHIGGEPIDWSMSGVDIHRTGRVEASVASDAVAAMDLMINPFVDGISTRRGSAMAALQNGVPVLSTRGHATDGIWTTQQGKSVFLAPPNDPIAWLQTTRDAFKSINRNMVSKDAIKKFYDDNFSWHVIAKTLCEHLGAFAVA